mmetsp:Transcript_142048/g.441698  ORF Transcript_142048/g.441698 Transcript_142048/m.441698 type:complete len:763 (-) Transcript_142048:254-2542(-)
MKGLLKGFCSGKGKGKGKGKCGKGKGKFWEEPREQGAATEPRAVGEGARIGPSVSALLSPRALAGVATVMLPKAISFLAPLEPEVLGQHLLAALGHLPELRSWLEGLRPLLAPAGLGHVEELLGVLLSEGAAADAAGKFLLALLTGLDALHFDACVRLLEKLFASQEERLAELVDRVEMHFPFLSGMLEHRSITCDGCGTSPIKGPRFKCEACADYDLCTECFARRSQLHGGPCADHQFRCEAVDRCSLHQAKSACMEVLGKGMLKGMKGMMKGLWGKGMCKGKGKHQPSWGEGRTCARPECNFQATWHWTHCCAACAAGLGHGVCCERKDSERMPSSPAHQHGHGNGELSKTADAASMRPAPGHAAGARASTDDTNIEEEAAVEHEEPAVEPEAREEQPKTAARPVRACAKPECGFQATWHKTHCCATCANGEGHGHRCERKTQPQRDAQAHEEAPEDPAAEPKTKEERSWTEAAKVRACARPECRFQATWHKTHCCATCATGTGHGQRCERKAQPPQDSRVCMEEPKSQGAKPEAEEEQPETEAAEVRACARPGCGFQATWHKTHCCAACAAGRGHGQRCERKAQPQHDGEAGEEAPEAPAAEPEAKDVLGTEHAEAAGDGAALAEGQLSFHVVLEDGRRLLLELKSGADAAEVAKGFAMQHGLGEEQVAQLMAAIQSAERAAGCATEEEEEKATAGPDPPSADGREVAAEAPDPFQEQISQIKDMGFMGISDEDLRALLQALGGNLQQAVEVLMAHVQQ